MRKRRLLWQIYPYFLLLVLLALGAVAWYATLSTKRFYYDQTRGVMETRAKLVARDMLPSIESGDPVRIDRQAKQIGALADTRVTVIRRDGVVLGDSEADPALMENHADRPEIASALNGRIGFAVRLSPTLGYRMMYSAIPLNDGLSDTLVVRVALPIRQIDKTIRDLQAKILFVALLTAAFGAFLALLLSRRIARPVERMRRDVDTLASGDLAHRLDVPDLYEIGRLAEGINHMAAQLDDRILAVTRQRNEQEAVFASMIEGVLAVDSDEKIIRINDAAAKLLDIDRAGVQGRTIQETVRHPDLQEIISRALAADAPVEGEILLDRDNERCALQIHGAALRDAQGRKVGAVIVLNDLTRIRRLESFRRDFVANVSHELRTPITSIKGFVETLLDGAIHDTEQAGKFLAIVARQVDRLDAIIRDLLLLSSIEQQNGALGASFQDASIEELLKSAVQLCAHKADRKGVQIALSVPAGLRGTVNVHLLEQAVVNLIDNAVKYSPSGGVVHLDAAQDDREISISVRDHGCGIPPEHLSRIFERFYVVDKARSRDMGGTGLGLAIAKHIAQAHRGAVTVESIVGEGACFTLHLPAA
jgi:two-component system phosphate regulon sensor histidine kinase PhoR